MYAVMTRIMLFSVTLLSVEISAGGHTANSGLNNGSSFIIAVTAAKHPEASRSCFAASSESAAGRLLWTISAAAMQLGKNTVPLVASLCA